MKFDNNKISKAAAFCVAAHSAIGQKRLYSGLDYWTHPFAVASILREHFPDDTDLIVAGYLHDVVEDTKITLELVHAEFGFEVGELVYWVTNLSDDAESDNILRLSKASVKAQNLKIADIVHNCQDLRAMNPQYADKYFAKKRNVLSHFRQDEVNAALMARAMTILNA